VHRTAIVILPLLYIQSPDLPSVLLNGTVGSQPVCCEIVSRRMIRRIKVNVHYKKIT